MRPGLTGRARNPVPGSARLEREDACFMKVHGGTFRAFLVRRVRVVLADQQQIRKMPSITVPDESSGIREYPSRYARLHYRASQSA